MESISLRFDDFEHTVHLWCRQCRQCRTTLFVSFQHAIVRVAVAHVACCNPTPTTPPPPSHFLLIPSAHLHSQLHTYMCNGCLCACLCVCVLRLPFIRALSYFYASRVDVTFGALPSFLLLLLSYPVFKESKGIICRQDHSIWLLYSWLFKKILELVQQNLTTKPRHREIPCSPRKLSLNTIYTVYADYLQIVAIVGQHFKIVLGDKHHSIPDKMWTKCSLPGIY